MNKETEDLGEELYSLLAELLNRRGNRAVQDSIRGEYGALHYLTYIKDGTSAGELTKYLHIVPGRMTDILSSLEYKGYIERKKSKDDGRRIEVWITPQGKKVAEEKREQIRIEYTGMIDMLGEKDVKEFIRLLKIVLTYNQADREA